MMPKDPNKALLQRTPSLLHCETPELQKPLVQLMETQNFRVTVSTTWPDATAHVRGTTPAVIVAAVAGPVGYALDLVCAFQELDPGIPVVVVGPFPRVEDQVHLLRRYQAFDVVPPPPDGVAMLSLALQKALHHRQRLLSRLRQYMHDGKKTRKVEVMLTPREADILALVAEGLSNKQAAQQLELSEHTIRNGLARVFDKLGAGTRLQAINNARALRLIP
jgi:two-component system response regulator FixJ